MTEIQPLLTVAGLKTHFYLDEGVVKAVDGVDFEVYPEKTLCIVGESGCGKSVTAHSILRVVADPGRVIDGRILYDYGTRPRTDTSRGDTVDIAALDPRGKDIRSIRGREIAMIFQEPMTALSPVHTIGNQIMEGIELHLGLGKQEAEERTVELLRRVGLPKPASRVDAYTFELSGGMRQRAMIAMGLACGPSMLIADEPTTAVDVTTQAQILDLMLELQDDNGMALMFITHDLGVVAEIADDVAVMYLGRVVERGSVDDIFHNPLHPYTRALLESIPKLEFHARKRLDSIRGMVPDPYNRPPGCTFHPRCDSFMPGICDVAVPPRITLAKDRETRCWLHADHGERVRFFDGQGVTADE